MERHIIEKKQPSSSFEWMKVSFYFTYVLLLTTGSITLIEALSTSSAAVRHIMNLETCISLIAGYFYSQFTAMLSTGKVDYTAINGMRYTDWFITTPLMLLVIMMSLSYNNTKHASVHVGIYMTAVLLNFGMLYSGYLGDTKTITKKTGCAIGFVFFTLLFALLYFQFIKGSSHLFNFLLFGVYFVVWSMYGIVYLLDDETKNTIYNILDLIAKCLVGIGLWLYFTKIIVA
jgi:bacteriorhodopsin